MNSGKNVVLGAGMSGLAAATMLAAAGRPVALYEMAQQAGGRCRSYHDEGLGTTIDNGNHLVLFGNTDVQRFLKRVRSTNTLHVLPARYPFVDLKSNIRWSVDLGESIIPWWLLSKTRRVPGAAFRDYARSLRIVTANKDQTVEQVLGGTGALFERFWKPFSIAVLNTAPSEAAAELLKPVFREVFLKGGRASRPVLPKIGLSQSFVDPAIEYLTSHGTDVVLGERCVGIVAGRDRISQLRFSSGREINIVDGDRIIVALPPIAAKKLLPSLSVPDVFRPIVNVHFRHSLDAECPPIFGILNAITEWVFVRNDVISVTISDAQHVIEKSQDEIAQTVWEEICSVFDDKSLPRKLPPFRVIKEKRATIVQTPHVNESRPSVETRWKNLFLAGDWTQTGLPATIEGSVRSGHHAAGLILKGH